MSTLEQENERLRGEVETLEFALFWAKNPVDVLVPKTKASEEYVQALEDVALAAQAMDDYDNTIELRRALKRLEEFY